MVQKCEERAVKPHRGVRWSYVLWLVIVAIGAVRPLAAQEPTRSADTTAVQRQRVLRRAQMLVNDGSGAEGRALIDSLLNSTDPRSDGEADALFWRAMLAESWENAQRDYLRVMLDHERSPLAAAAMFRLAQGELARGDRDAAQRYLERLAREVPESELRPEAGLWQGRLLLERGNRAGGCAVLRELQPRVPPGALELERQYEFLLRGCEGVEPPSSPRASTQPAPGQQPAAGALVWTVQIAAIQSAAEARRFAERMRARGYATRVDGTSAPYRVRFGRYESREAATAAMNAYKQKERGAAFLVQVPRE
jgi:hypothetical protein